MIASGIFCFLVIAIPAVYEYGLSDKQRIALRQRLPRALGGSEGGYKAHGSNSSDSGSPAPEPEFRRPSQVSSAALLKGGELPS